MKHSRIFTNIEIGFETYNSLLFLVYFVEQQSPNKCTKPVVKPHHSTTYVDAAYSYSILTDCVAWCVGLSVSLSVTIVSPAKAAEPIETPFGLWSRVGHRNHVLAGVHIHHGKGQF